MGIKEESKWPMLQRRGLLQTLLVFSDEWLCYLAAPNPNLKDDCQASQLLKNLQPAHPH